ncbi:MAG: hypothetical protein EOM51_08205 [Clostridia bacterium]|nr:hypothetical protein [Clostridia bacterium]
MKKRIIWGSFAALTVVVIAFLIIYYGPTDSSHVISMPSPAASNGDLSGDDGISRVEVNPDTVKTVLGTLVRAESFYRSYTIKTYWDGGDSETSLSYWQKGDNIKLRIAKNESVRNILVRGDELYIWYDNSSSVFNSKLSESSVSKEIDRFSGLVTYEEIMDIPQDNILDAYYVDKSGQACIFVEYVSGELNYVNQLFVSVDSGLLVSSEKFDGDKLVYSMESASPELTTPSDDVFKVPG